MNPVKRTTAAAAVQQLRQRFWDRLSGHKIVRATDLVRVHRHAQQSGVSPEEAIVDLGLMTSEQVMEFFRGEQIGMALQASA